MKASFILTKPSPMYVLAVARSLRPIARTLGTKVRIGRRAYPEEVTIYLNTGPAAIPVDIASRLTLEGADVGW